MNLSPAYTDQGYVLTLIQQVRLPGVDPEICDGEGGGGGNCISQKEILVVDHLKEVGLSIWLWGEGVLLLPEIPPPPPNPALPPA